MELTFVAKDPDSWPGGSPTLYHTDRQSWIVQGWTVTDPDALATMDIPVGETCVMLRGHRAAGRTCRRARIVSEPLSEYQRWSLSIAEPFVDAGEDIRFVPRPRLATISLPGSGDYYVFDDELVFFLHYAGSGLNAGSEITEDPQIVRTCREAFEAVWKLSVPFSDYRPE